MHLEKLKMEKTLGGGGGDIGTNEHSLVLFNLSHKVNGP